MTKSFGLDMIDIVKLAHHYVDTLRYSKEFKLMSYVEQERIKLYKKQLSAIQYDLEKAKKNEV